MFTKKPCSILILLALIVILFFVDCERMDKVSPTAVANPEDLNHALSKNPFIDWTKNPTNDHYYRLTASMNWMEAEAQAQEWGGHLVTLSGWEEELWIKNTFGENELFWIGFNDIETEGNWVWSSGEVGTYTNWAQGEPNNYNEEDAAVMNWCWEGASIDPCLGDYWNDLPANAHIRGVVEKAIFEVSIDIKPGSDPNSINPKSNGVIPVAILTDQDFDATTVDVSTVVFGPDEAEPVHNGHIEDVDGDNDLDLLLHFKTSETGIQCGDTAASLTGATFSGQGIEGSDLINTVGCN